MQVSVTGRNIELTDPLKEYVSEKLNHLNHSFDQMIDVHVVLSVQKFHQRAEITIHANGITIHGHKETEDMYASIDGVVDKLNRQLKRYRAKLQKHSQRERGNGQGVKVAHRVVQSSPEVEEIPADYAPEILHHESIGAKPMSIDEALMQLELSSQQPVLVFTNRDTDCMNVLYRKPDGHFGWIEPERA
ncbi:MAG: ribosome-associated translation inhibitor RaiA [Mariprofundaceae bacterium]